MESRNQTREEILRLLKEICEDDVIYSDPDINLLEEGLMGLLDYTTLFVLLSGVYNVSILPAEISREGMDTPNKIIGIVENKLEDTAADITYTES